MKVFRFSIFVVITLLISACSSTPPEKDLEAVFRRYVNVSPPFSSSWTIMSYTQLNHYTRVIDGENYQGYKYEVSLADLSMVPSRLSKADRDAWLANQGKATASPRKQITIEFFMIKRGNEWHYRARP